MPITAKLSRKFYEKVGEEAANELVEWFNSVDATYRADLREINDANFMRFDAKLGERIADLRGETRVALAQLEATLRTELAHATGELRNSLLKWMFGFWASTLFGLGALFFRR